MFQQRGTGGGKHFYVVDEKMQMGYCGHTLLLEGKN